MSKAAANFYAARRHLKLPSTQQTSALYYALKPCGCAICPGNGAMLMRGDFIWTRHVSPGQPLCGPGVWGHPGIHRWLAGPVKASNAVTFDRFLKYQNEAVDSSA
eukprot:scaffold273166_cov46-Prasinocladus_malaysianus.AAC.2